MVRELAEYHPDRLEAILRWPMREALISYRERMLAAARAAYKHELTLWSAIAPHSSKKMDAPKPPAILREVVH
jgi:hypothetical protein